MNFEELDNFLKNALEIKQILVSNLREVDDIITLIRKRKTLLTLLQKIKEMENL